MERAYQHKSRAGGISFSKSAEYDNTLSEIQTQYIYEKLKAKVVYWKGHEPEKIGDAMKKKVFDPMLELKKIQDNYTMLTRTTYKTVS